jgi:hypothetical protein
MVAGLVSIASLAEASPPLDPARQYRVRADGVMTVSGPECCGSTRFTGRLEASYTVRSSREAAIGTLRFILDDADVVVHVGFLDLFARRIRLRCANVAIATPAPGRFDGVDKIDFGAGAFALAGASAEARDADGTCADPTLALEATNDVPLAVRHDPARNLFGLAGSFRTTIDGDTYVFAIDVGGTFDNRPPLASLAIDTPAVPQGSCPAYARPLPQGGVEMVAQANDPAGLVGTLRSRSTDPDPPGGRGDVLADRWFRSRGAGDREHVGDGFRFGPVTFEWGPTHRLELLSLDHRGAGAVAACSFRVIDSVAPVVTPPAPITLACSQPGGAASATSPPLRAFLSGGTARDAGDGAPSRLTPLTGGVPVTDTMLFPADGWPRTVRFRFQDRWGNVGSADSRVTVQDTVAPTATVALTPATLPPLLKYHWINAVVSATDDCGAPVTLRLVRIKSNAPAFDAGDVLDATYGTDDRAFYLFSRLAAPGVPRVYTVVYEAVDASGNVRSAVAQVVVG